MPFGLDENTITKINNVFELHPEIVRVKIYGSRAKGNYKNGSDIDIAFFSDNDNDITGKLLVELDELSTPYLFDVTNYNKLNHKELKEHIDRVGQILYSKKE